MKKNVFGRKFGRDKEERKALFKSLMSTLILNERVKTTEAKAKAIRPEIERLVTKAKKKESGAWQVLEKSLSGEAFEKIIKEIGPRFEKRQGGYTRIIKLGERLGDDSSMVLLEWVDKQIQNSEVKIQNTENKKSVKKEEKKLSKTKKIAKTKKDNKAKKANPSSRKATKGK